MAAVTTAAYSGENNAGDGDPKLCHKEQPVF